MGRTCLAVLSIASLMISLARGATIVQTQANQVAQWSFTSAKDRADPFNELEFDAVVTTPGGAELRMPALWAGGKTWRVRYASPEVGTHRFKTVCSDAGDAGLHGVEGSVEIAAYSGDNPLYRHGPIRVAADKKHFEHIDGTPFFWLGDTWWMSLTKRLHFPDEFATLTKDRVGKGFTVVQIVAGLYPDMPAFDERGANEAGFPWEKDYARINPAYFDAADQRIAYLADHGLVPCVVGAWGYHLPWLGVDRMKKHWRYVIARWGAYPTFWCTAGEGAMPYYLAADKPKDGEFQKRGWTEIAAYIRKTDPFHRPVTIHPTDLARNQVTDPSVLDFEMLQTGHGDRASIMPTIGSLRASRAAKPTMPTLNSEVCYEGILGTCPAEIQRIMGWTSLLAGTAGHTYGANGIWQVNRKDQPYGKSPHGGNWGETPWDEAMRLPGSAQTGHAKKLLERFQWWRFQPHPEWAAWDVSDEKAADAIKWGDWIWHAGDGDASRGAPAERRWFRKTFDLPADIQLTGAELHLSADDQIVSVKVNGENVGSHRGWERPKKFDIARLLRAGPNTIVIEGENLASGVTTNPAGLLSGGDVITANGPRVSLASDASWSSNSSPDGVWMPAKSVAPYGAPPWGVLPAYGSGDAPIAAAGIAGEVRVIYVPAPRPVQLSKLERDVNWQAEWFDPVNGKLAALPKPTIDADGSCRIPPPAEAVDWVLVLRRR
ncbi:MAG: DUF4038 domain-containing protein [Tepidisphaeraceae bacterium]